MDLRLIMEGRSFTLFSLEIGFSVIAFLSKLKREDIHEYDRIIRRLEQLADRGPSRRKDEFNILGSDIFEAKSKRGARVVFFYDRNCVVICVYGFSKQKDKTPRQIIKTAQERKTAYETQKKSGQEFNILVPANLDNPRRMP